MRHCKSLLLQHFKLTLLTLLTLSLFGCASNQPLQSDLASQSNALAKQAQAYLDNQQFSVAADLFVQLANINKAPLKNDYTIAAIDAYLNAGDLDSANPLINNLLKDEYQLLPNQGLNLARILLEQGKAERAIQLLLGLDESQLSTEQRINLHQVASSAFLQSGNLTGSAHERIVLDALLTTPDEKLSNQIRLLETLSLLSQQSLDTLRPTADPDMAGWIDLVSILKKQTAFEPNNPDLVSWKAQYPTHPANSLSLDRMAQQAMFNFKAPNKVGVFLPTEGTFAHAAYSIRKGIAAAAFSTANQWGVDINFYDTSTTPVEALYAQAIKDGVSVIIGPLDKANTTKIASLDALPIPVISLNKSDANNSNYYEFSLAPEEDVTQVLSLAWLKGHEKALIFTPQSRYGTRLANHFSTVWQQLGGDVLAVESYPLKEADYSAPIRSLLQLDDSMSRYKQLRRRLNLDLQFEDRRRHDADFIFLIAAPREGRLIKPQLRFHRATKLAVFSTSKIYDGKLDTVSNRDLDGVFFCDMPWLIDTTNDKTTLDSTLTLWPDTQGAHLRLVAFGYDAYQLIPHLERLQVSDFARFKGETGILSMGTTGQISRQLSCGQFKRGIAESQGLAPYLEKAVNITPSTPALEQPVQVNTSPL